MVNEALCLHPWPDEVSLSFAGEGPVQEIAVIHTLAEVPGARSLIRPNDTRAEAAAAAAEDGAGNAAANSGLELFEGGSLADVVAAASAVPPAPQGGGGGGRWGSGRGPATRSQSRQPSVHVYHGVCAWSEGQLEGMHLSAMLPFQAYVASVERLSLAYNSSCCRSILQLFSALRNNLIIMEECFMRAGTGC